MWERQEKTSAASDVLLEDPELIAAPDEMCESFKTSFTTLVFLGRTASWDCNWNRDLTSVFTVCRVQIPQSWSGVSPDVGSCCVMDSLDPPSDPSFLFWARLLVSVLSAVASGWRQQTRGGVFFCYTLVIDAVWVKVQCYHSVWCNRGGLVFCCLPWDQQQQQPVPSQPPRTSRPTPTHRHQTLLWYGMAFMSVCVCVCVCEGRAVRRRFHTIEVKPFFSPLIIYSGVKSEVDSGCKATVEENVGF